MLNQVKIFNSKPEDTKKGVIAEIAKLILNGNTLPGTSQSELESRLKKAHRIVYAVEDDVIVGTVVLKNPNTGYKNGLFAERGIAEKADDYQAEVGYGYVTPAERRKDLYKKMFKTLIDSIPTDWNVYATTRSQFVLEHGLKFGFVPVECPELAVVLRLREAKNK